MNTLYDNLTQASNLPHFSDGMINLTEVLRLLAEGIANEIMSSQANELCTQGNQRNGYRERKLITTVGEITLRMNIIAIGNH